MYRLLLTAVLGFGLVGCELADNKESDDLGFTQNEELNGQLREADDHLQVTRLSSMGGNDYSIGFPRQLNYKTTITNQNYDYQNIEFYTFKHDDESRNVSIRITPADVSSSQLPYENITLLTYEDGSMIGSQSAENGEAISIFPYVKQGSEYTFSISTTSEKLTYYTTLFHLHFDQEDLKFDENGNRVFEEVSLNTLDDPELTYLHAFDDNTTGECHEYGHTSSAQADAAINSLLEYGSCKEELGSSLMGYCNYTYDNVENRRYYFSNAVTEENAAAICIGLGEVDYITITP